MATPAVATVDVVHAVALAAAVVCPTSPSSDRKTWGNGVVPNPAATFGLVTCEGNPLQNQGPLVEEECAATSTAASSTTASLALGSTAALGNAFRNLSTTLRQKVA